MFLALIGWITGLTPKYLYCFSNFVIFIYAYLPKFNIERYILIFIEIMIGLNAFFPEFIYV